MDLIHLIRNYSVLPNYIFGSHNPCRKVRDRKRTVYPCTMADYGVTILSDQYRQSLQAAILTHLWAGAKWARYYTTNGETENAKRY